MASEWCLPLLRSWALIATCCVLVACDKDIPRPPIVTNQTEPWQEELAQEKRERELSEQPQRPHRVVKKGYGYDQKTDEDKHNVIVTTLADIVAFPLRGAAWVARTLL